MHVMVVDMTKGPGQYYSDKVYVYKGGILSFLAGYYAGTILEALNFQYRRGAGTVEQPCHYTNTEGPSRYAESRAKRGFYGP